MAVLKLYRNTVEGIIKALQQIFSENSYADKVIERILKQNPRWGSHDRRFIAESTYEIVRWYRLLKEASGDSEPSFWKLFGTWCIVNEIELPGWSEFENTDAEKILNNYEKLKSIRKIRESIPDWLDEIGSNELGKEWDKEIEALNQQAKVVLRVNTLKTTKEHLQKLLADQQIETESISKFPDALILKKRQSVFQLKEFKEGLFELQDASSQVVGTFLNAEPGMRIIDACAGGGGKTLHLAALMKNKGRIIAMDVEQWKLEELKKRARRAGAGNIETKLIESGKTIKRLSESADRLLLDVPCSGLGVLKRNPDAKWKLSLDFIEKVKTMQQEILNSYCSMLKPGGIMVYATCSLLASENEKQVQNFINEQKDSFELLEEKRIMPSEGFDGFYMARLKKL